MFYPDIKKHISPSAFNSWHKQRSTFIKTYFKGIKTPETPAMKAGTKIHGLIEAGFLSANYRFDNREKTIVVPVTGGVNVLGIPDSHEVAEKEVVTFVDYKTGKENGYTREVLATDLKLKCTAWLVFQENPNAKEVRGVIEWFGTEWNGAEIVPTGEQSHIGYTYSAEELRAFTEVIEKTITEINKAYEEFLVAPTESLVNEEDVEEYAKLDLQKKEIEIKQKAIKERIAEQLEFSGQNGFEHPMGSFYFTVKKSYKYPDELEFQTESGDIMTVALGEEVVLAMGSAKKNYELNHEPESVTRSLGFRPKK